MTDIYDIKDILLWFPININYSLVYIIFLIFLYFLWKYLNNNKQEKIEEIVEVEEKVENKDFNKILEEIEKKYINIEKNIFYMKLSEFLRDLLEFKWYKDISKMTYKEISRLDLDKNIKNIIKNIYFKEYKKEIIDSEKQRKEIINDIKKIINK